MRRGDAIRTTWQTGRSCRRIASPLNAFTLYANQRQGGADIQNRDFCRLRTCFAKRAVSYLFDTQHHSTERTYVWTLTTGSTTLIQSPVFSWPAFRQLLRNPEVTAFTRCRHWSVSWAVLQESNENIWRNRLRW